MKKFIACVALSSGAKALMMYAQKKEICNAAAHKSKKLKGMQKGKKLRAEEEECRTWQAYQQAVQALKNKQFVLEANRVIFRNGMSAFCYFKHLVLMNGKIEPQYRLLSTLLIPALTESVVSQ